MARLALVVCLLGALVFFLDISLPHGALAGMPYVMLVMLGWFADDRRFALAAGAVTTLLTIAGHPFSPPGGEAWIDLANRAVSLATIWCAAILLLGMKARDSAAARMHESLTRRILAHDDEMAEAQAALIRMERLAAVNESAGTVAHELRNPLGVIVTSINVIETRAAQAGLDIRSALDRAQRAVRRCELIIDEHLDAARARGHRPKPVVLDNWLSGVLADIAVNGDITLKTDFQSGDTVVPLDPESFRRAIINLVDNARQAIADGVGDPVVTVGSRTYSESVEIFVADNGPGIPADLLARVTETLFSTRPSGTGLGLPTVQRIIDHHGGSMAIESAPGRGTRVTLRLPRSGQS